MAAFYYPSFDVAIIDSDGYRVAVTSGVVTATNIRTATKLADLAINADGIVVEGSFADTVAQENDVVEISHVSYPETVRFTLKATQELAYTAWENDVTTYIADDDFINNVPPGAVELFLEDRDNPGQAPILIGTVLMDKASSIAYQTTTTKNARIYAVPVTADFQRGLNDPSQFPFTDITIPGASDTASRPLADFYTDATTTDTAGWHTLYEYPGLANLFENIGDEIRAEYAVELAGNVDQKQFRVLFNGQLVNPSGTIATSQDGNAGVIRVSIMRTDTDTVRASADAQFEDNPLPEFAEIDTLNFGNALPLILQGRTPSTIGDLIAKKGKVMFVPAIVVPEGLVTFLGQPVTFLGGYVTFNPPAATGLVTFLGDQVTFLGEDVTFNP